MRRQTQKNVANPAWPENNHREVAKELVEKIFEKLAETSSSAQQKDGKFFPDGIELIDFKLKVSPVELELKVAGAAGIKGLLSKNQALDWEQISAEKNSLEEV